MLFPTSGTATESQVDSWLNSNGYASSSLITRTVRFRIPVGQPVPSGNISVTFDRRVRGEAASQVVLCFQGSSCTGILNNTNGFYYEGIISYYSCDELRLSGSLTSGQSGGISLVGKNTGFSGSCGSATTSGQSTGTGWFDQSSLCWGYEIVFTA